MYPLHIFDLDVPALYRGDFAPRRHNAEAPECECQISRRTQLGDASQADSHYLVVARDLDPSIKDDSHHSWTEEATVITSDMHRGYVVPDGWDEYHFNRGTTITVDLKGPSMQLLTFRHTMIEKFQKK